MPTPTVIHLFQPGHTYSNKATPLNVATPWSKNIQTITGEQAGRSLSSTISIAWPHPAIGMLGEVAWVCVRATGLTVEQTDHSELSGLGKCLLRARGRVVHL